MSSPKNFSHIAFNPEAIDQQLQKIFADTIFLDSEILKRFLDFIVHETLHGRSNQLKEYTIAMNVLGKTPDFRPQENAIVRIHAGRLRRALFQYYSGRGVNDKIIINIPKGKYVVEFWERGRDVFELNESRTDRYFPERNNSLPIKVVVMPLLSNEFDPRVNAFGDGLCLQMSSVLMHAGKVSVMAYQAVKSLLATHPDLQQLGECMGCDYFVGGGIQLLDDTLRINLQLVRVRSCEQIWSNVFERQLLQSNEFKLQDEISACVASVVENLDRYGHRTNQHIPFLAAG